MQTLKIKCYRLNETVPDFSFFILSKGNNAGKPMWNPCPNCFVLTADNEDEKEKLYWLLYGLWQGACFHPFLIGSVIPFLRIDDLKKVIREALIKVHKNAPAFMKAISLLQKLETHQNNIHEQLKVMRQIKRNIIAKTLQDYE